eukprot:scaffold222325_cov29-Prasinocladus_malaysianus.AAC.4
MKSAVPPVAYHLNAALPEVASSPMYDNEYWSHVLPSILAHNPRSAEGCQQTYMRINHLTAVAAACVAGLEEDRLAGAHLHEVDAAASVAGQEEVGGGTPGHRAGRTAPTPAAHGLLELVPQNGHGEARIVAAHLVVLAAAQDVPVVPHREPHKSLLVDM